MRKKKEATDYALLEKFIKNASHRKLLYIMFMFYTKSHSFKLCDNYTLHNNYSSSCKINVKLDMSVFFSIIQAIGIKYLNEFFLIPYISNMLKSIFRSHTHFLFISNKYIFWRDLFFS